MSDLVFSLLAPSELSPTDIGAWREIVAADKSLAGPYFSPDFSLAVGRVRRDLELAVWREGRELRAVLPFHRRRFQTALPVAGPLNDYQALIAGPDVALSAERILADCRLKAFDYRYWFADRVPEGAHHREVGAAPYLDLSQGFDAYVAGRRQAGVSELHKTFKKRRKLEREVGPVRLVADSDDPRLMDALTRWKQAQYRRTRHFMALSIGWYNDVVSTVQASRSAHFGGMLSGLYAGDNLIAVHFGMRTDKVLHYWFPAHDIAYAQYSPGMILALAVAEHLGGEGLERIDLGKGDTRFKTSLGSDGFLVEGGYFGGEAWPAKLRDARFAFERGFERLPIGEVGTWPRRVFNRIELALERRYR